MNDNTLYESDLYPKYRFTKKGQIYWQHHSGDWRELKPFKNTRYLRVNLFQKDGSRRKEMLHRVIAKVFIPNPENYPCINHKDENPYNNAVDNLEWCTYFYNNHYGNRPNKVRESRKWADEKHKKPVKGVNKSGVEFYFSSIKEAAKEIGGLSGNIWRCLEGRSKTAYGYKWYRRNKEDEE